MSPMSIRKENKPIKRQIASASTNASASSPYDTEVWPSVDMQHLEFSVEEAAR